MKPFRVFNLIICLKSVGFKIHENGLHDMQHPERVFIKCAWFFLPDAVVFVVVVGFV